MMGSKIAAALSTLLVFIGLTPAGNAARVTKEFALVKSDGTLVAGVMAASSARLATGDYTVKFKNDVSACVYSTGVQSTTLGVDPGGGSARSFNLGGNGQTVEIKIGQQGSPVDRDFNIIVVC